MTCRTSASYAASVVTAGPPPRRQAGMTALGALILVAFIGLFAFAGIRLTPVYLNYFKVVGVIDGVFQEFDGQNASIGEIRTSIARRFDVESITELTAREVKVQQADGGFEVRAEYDHKTPFIGNVSFSVHFNKSKLVRR